jgi:hypothetical protein
MTAAPIDRPTHAVRDNPALNRYELIVDERLIGIAEYRRVDGTLVLPHTEIQARERGSGWGDMLVGAALDDIRRQGLQIVPQCWFVAEFVDRNPQYADLLA